MSENLHVHGREEQHATYLARSLQKTFPQLLEYLRPDARVLDVGCGPGSITVDVAEYVGKGSVLGIDAETASIERARDLAKKRGISNVDFDVHDACKLSFEDNSFDVTYSHALFDWLLDPIRALEEQRRVTKKGGWVCAMMTTHGTTMMYPCFPALWSFFQSWRYWADPTNPATYHDRFVGRKSVELFKRAGFRDVLLRPMEPRVWHAGQPVDDLPPLRMIGSVLDPSKDLARRFADRLLQLGAIDEWTIGQARQEWALFVNNPYALYVQVNLFAAGTVEK